MQTVFLFRDAQYVLTSRLNINIYQLFLHWPENNTNILTIIYTSALYAIADEIWKIAVSSPHWCTNLPVYFCGQDQLNKAYKSFFFLL